MRDPRTSRARSAIVAAALATAAPAAGSSALAGIAPEIVRGIGPVPPRTVVVVAPLASDATAPRADDLAVRLATVVAGRLGDSVDVHARPEPFSVAQAVAAKAGALVYLQAEIARGQLRATADLYASSSNGWDRARAPVPAPRAHAFASAPIDAEVRGYLSALSLDHLRVEKTRQDVGDVLAASCGDIDGDGVNDLLMVGRASVAWGRIQGGRFVPAHSAAWSGLARRAAVPLREPIASAAVLPRADGTGADLLAGTTDRGGVSLSRDLRGAAPLRGLPLFAGAGALCVRPSPAASALEGGLTDCGDFRPEGAPALTARYDAIAVAELVGVDGGARRVVAAREPGSGALRVRLGDKEETFGAVGAQLALGDLDQDGFVEVATSADGGPDGLVISSVRGNALVPRLRVPAPSGVQALAICPPDSGGPSAVVAVVAAEVWVVR